MCHRALQARHKRLLGTPSEVPRILTICILALIAVVLLIITGFMGFGKQET